MQIVEYNPEVFFAKDQIVRIKGGDLGFLQKGAEQSRRRRARLCAHRDVDDKLHEMIVVLMQDAYLIPEKHITKVESYHFIEGVGDVVIFDEIGNITEVVQMGDYWSGRPFYYRIFDPFYHTLIIRSASLVYHETATGRFSKSDTVVAPWAPAENDIAGRKAFMEGLERKVEKFLSTSEKDRDRN